MSSKTIWLLRAEKENDPYKKVFIEGGYDPAFIEVLSFEFVNLAELADKLRKSENYGGLVLTSQNASSSIACAIERGLLSRDEVVSGWSSLPVYVVGGATASSVCSLGLECVGEESGKAETLSDFIIHHHKKGESPSQLPLLFPCGNLRKDTLPGKLTAAGFALDEVLCYNTCATNDIAINVAELVKQKGHPQWVILFSPSGVQYTSREVPHIFQGTKICAFGPTTSEALQEHGLPVHTTFSAPYKPDRLLTLISEHGQPTSSA